MVNTFMLMVMCYLLDKALGFTENQRITEAATERIYREAVQTSYRKGGETISEGDKVNFRIPEQKRVVEYLYIDADEDHYSLQFRNKKGDIER